MSTLLTLLVILLILCSAFFSAAEIVYAQASKPRIRASAEDGDPRAVRAQGIIDDFVRAISTILVGNNLVNIATTSVITLLCVRYYFPGNANAELFAEGGATVLILIFGEIFPKILAADHANRLALSFGGLLRGFMGLFKPMVTASGWLVERLARLWTPEEPEPSMTDEELALVVDSIQEEGVFTESDGELIKSAIGFGDLTAHDILIPRVDMIAYNLEDPLEELLGDEEAMSCSRLPVYREDIDHIVGILPTKQLMKAVLIGEADIDICSLLVPPVFVHMTKNISDILRDFRSTKSNMAIVLDEYGGTMGLLTTEDILEEIVGEIYDETDEVETDYKEITEDTFLLEGDLTIEDVFEIVGYEPRDFHSEYTTLSGWITELLDRFPAVGDEVRYDCLTLTVKTVEGPLVGQAQLRIERAD